MYVMYVDLEKAYDSVDRGLLWRVLLGELRLPHHLVAALQRLYMDLTVSLAGATELGTIPVR